MTESIEIYLFPLSLHLTLPPAHFNFKISRLYQHFFFSITHFCFNKKQKQHFLLPFSLCYAIFAAFNHINEFYGLRFSGFIQMQIGLGNRIHGISDDFCDGVDIYAMLKECRYKGMAQGMQPALSL